MSPYERLVSETAPSRQDFLATPILQQALSGDIDRDAYLAFLGQAYHHVRHTVPLLMGCGYRLPERLEWLRPAMAEYIAEEMGHEHWILDDIQAAGGDAEAARQARPNQATELMVAYAYDLVGRRNPVGFLGMVFVLEGTSASLASQAAEVIRTSLGLPKSAFRYHQGCESQQFRADLDAGARRRLAVNDGMQALALADQRYHAALAHQCIGIAHREHRCIVHCSKHA